MKKQFSLFCGLALLISNSCAMAAAFSVISIVEGMEKHDPGLLIWLLCLSFCYVGLRLYLRQGRNERSVIIFCAVFFLLQVLLIFAVHGLFSGTIGILAAVCMWLYGYYSCYDLGVNGVSADKLTKSFDLCSLFLVFVLFFCSVKGVSLKTLLPLFLSVLLCLFALIVIRAGQQRKMRSIVMSAGIVLGFAALSALFVAFASGGVKKLVEFLKAVIAAILNFVLHAIDAFFRFLASLIPEKDYDMPPPETGAAALGPMQESGFELIDPEIVMSVMIGIGLFIAVAMILYRIFRGKHFNLSINAVGDRAIRRRRRGVCYSLKRALRRLFEAVSFRVSAISLRNTAPGLFWQIERRSRPKLHGRKESESCREFLRRAESVYPHAKAQLMLLADAMDSACFGGKDILGTAEVLEMRKYIFNGNKKTEV